MKNNQSSPCNDRPAGLTSGNGNRCVVSGAAAGVVSTAIIGYEIYGVKGAVLLAALGLFVGSAIGNLCRLTVLHEQGRLSDNEVRRRIWTASP